MSSKINVKKYSMSVKMPGSSLSDLLMKHYGDSYLDAIKRSILTSNPFFTREEIIYHTPRFIVRARPESGVSIYDRKTNIVWKIQDVKENPKMFTPALVKKLPFLELYEKTQ
jgi:hypothetical protein